MHELIFGISNEACNDSVRAVTVFKGFQFFKFSRILLRGGGRLRGQMQM